MRFHEVLHYLLMNAGDELSTDLRRAFVHDFMNGQKFYFGSSARLYAGEIVWKEFPRLPFSPLICELERATEDGRFLSMITILSEEGDCVAAQSFFLTSKKIGASATLLLDRTKGSINYRVPPSWKNESDASELLDESINHLAWLGLAIRILNCKNVLTRTIEAPKKLNVKRERKGELPLFEYKVLEMRRSGTSDISGGGSHACPRVHLRRGHIKHRRTGDFWWQPHAVGDRKRGVVMKDYNARALLDDAAKSDRTVRIVSAAIKIVRDLRHKFPGMAEHIIEDAALDVATEISAEVRPQ